MADVFVSYAREDRPGVQLLASALEQADWTVWWDREVLAGDEFEAIIQKELDQAACVLVVWSSNSIKSNWVRNEAAEGLRRHVLIPVLLDDSEPPLAFRHIQNVRLEISSEVNADTTGFQELLRALRALIRRGDEHPIASPRAAAHTPGQTIDITPVHTQTGDGGETVRSSRARIRAPLLWVPAGLLIVATTTVYFLNSRNQTHTSPSDPPGEVVKPTSAPEAPKSGQGTGGLGSVMVAGTGKGRYFLSDATGKSLTNAATNTAVELFPGTYTVALNDTTQSLTVRAGQQATVSAGSVMVAGTGKGRYFVSDASGKSLTNAATNTAVELFPGTYTVALNDTTQSLTVRAGQQATVSAGSAMVAGTGKGHYFVSDASGKSLTNAATNTAVELFAGTYTVALNDTTRSLTVRAGQQATVSAGSVMVAGTGKGRYFVSDASGKSLTNADTNTAVELFPGEYVVTVNGTMRSLVVRAGQPTILK